MSRARKIVLTGGLCLLAVALALVGLRLLSIWIDTNAVFEAADNFDASEQPWTRCAVPFAEGHGSIVFLRRSSHPFLAEYDRMICFGDDPDSGAVRRLPINCGGRTCINVYWYEGTATEGPYLRLQDHWGVYIVDLRRKMLCLMRELDGVFYIGDIPADSNGAVGSGWSMADGETELKYTVDGRSGHKATGVLVDSAGVYIGRIDGRTGPPSFIPVNEASEEKIDIIR